MKPFLTLVLTIISIAFLTVGMSVAYHNYKLALFESQIIDWATQAGIKEYTLKSSISAGYGSGSFCDYSVSLIASARDVEINSIIEKFSSYEFSPAETSLHPKVDKLVGNGADELTLTIYNGGHKSLVDYRCI